MRSLRRAERAIALQRWAKAFGVPQHGEGTQMLRIGPQVDVADVVARRKDADGDFAVLAREVKVRVHVPHVMVTAVSAELDVRE